MVNPKKNLLMGLEVTEGSQKKAKNGQDSLVCFPCCDGQKEPPEKNLSWWWLQRRHSQGANGAAGWDPSTEPCPAAALDKAGQASLHFLSCCITWYLAPPHKVGLVKAFQLREHVWKNIIITEVFMFSGKGAKLELPRQEICFCFIVMTVAEGQTD